MIASGAHRFSHGVVESIDLATEIPFAIVALRGSRGTVLKSTKVYVPAKYCAVFDTNSMRAEAKLKRKEGHKNKP